MAAEVERHELISDMVHSLKHPFINAFMEIYNRALKNNKSNKLILRDFQMELHDISLWSSQRKDEETKKIGNVTKGLDELRRINKDLLGKEVDNISSRDFVFAAFLNIAREIWSKPILFYHRVNKSEYQKNIMSIEKLIVTEVKATIRRLPMKPKATVLAATATIVENALPTIDDPIPNGPMELVCDQDPKTLDMQCNVVIAQPRQLVERPSEIDRLPSIMKTMPQNDPEIKQVSVKDADTESLDEEYFNESESEFESDSSESESEYSDSENEKEILVEKVKLPRNKKSHSRSKKFKYNSMQAYKNYLNPRVFKPPRVKVSNRK